MTTRPKTGAFIAPGDRGRMDPARRDALIALEELGCSMGHRLRNPLAAMMLAVLRIKKRLEALPGEEKTVAVAAQLGASVENLSGEVDSLLRDLAMPPIACSPVDLDSTLDAALSLIVTNGAAGSDAFRRVRGKGAPWVIADQVLLQHALYNILAVSASSGAKGDPLTVETGADGQGAAIVRVGVGAEQDGFPDGLSGVKAHALLSAGGPGLSLAVARRILGLHGAQLAIRGQQGGARTVTVTLLETCQPQSGIDGLEGRR